ncbi:p-glycoprotein [Fusarium albosuccineum]|uniref:p-glycoprotein n=1 Tax=Fusarium albosuccineum TaxID=1237068 RepID=A0A8H4L3U2_9HYPO|nr:p-glycoprotein [Fusarium albosuccineum]
MSANEDCCVLCGVPIIILEAHDLSWQGNFRSIYTIGQAWNEPRLSPPQANRGCDTLKILHEKDGFGPSTVRVLFSPMRTSFFEENSDQAWGFLFHDSCWRVFNAHCASYGTRCDIQCLFDILRSHPIDEWQPMDWGHDYAGAYDRPIYRETGLYPNHPYWLCVDGPPPEAFLDDPLDIPELESAFAAVRSRRNQAKFLKGSYWNRSNKNADSRDPFSRIPHEVLSEIFIYLSAGDVVHLRQSSSACDAVILPVEFWRSRFRPGGDFAYVFEAESMNLTGRQWQHLWHRLELLDQESLFTRSNVWELSDWLRQLLEQRMGATTCHGAAVMSFFEPDAPKSHQVWTTATAQLTKADDEFHEGARALWQRSVSLPQAFSVIWISFAWTWGNKYVSGLRITQDSGPTMKIRYIHPTDEMKVTWAGDGGHGGDNILAFNLCMDETGLRGLAVETLSKGTSLWTGDYEDIPRRRLLLPGYSESPEQAITALQASFDALKVVSLSIASDGQNSHPPTTDTLRYAQLWCPDYPLPPLRLLGLDNGLTSEVSHLPFQTHIFGGKDGRYLPFLEEIVVSYQNKHNDPPSFDICAVEGIEFKYTEPVDEGESLIIGERTHLRKDGWHGKEVLRVDAARGERITQVEALYRPIRKNVRVVEGLRLRTNFGQCLEVPPRNAWPPRFNPNSDILKPERGTIVGLFLKLRHAPVIYDLGVMYIDEEV